MLETIDFFELDVIVSAKLRIALSERIGSFQQVITQVTITGFDKISNFGGEIAGLVFRPSDASILGESRMVSKTIYIADFRNDTGGIDLPDTFD